MDPHARPSQNGGGTFWRDMGPGYGYNQDDSRTGASDPTTMRPPPPQTMTNTGGMPPASGVAAPGGGGAGGGYTPADEISTSPGSLKVSTGRRDFHLPWKSKGKEYT